MKQVVLTLTSDQTPSQQEKLIQEQLDKGWRVQNSLNTNAQSGGMKRPVEAFHLVFRRVRRFLFWEW